MTTVDSKDGLFNHLDIHEILNEIKSKGSLDKDFQILLQL